MIAIVSERRSFVVNDTLMTNETTEIAVPALP
jgi:hypothetical protein